ncbi:MAG: hypothetical protein ACE5GV_02965 [Candidatus Scalindua sp.]
MSKEFQIERHKKLLEEKTKLVRRIVYGGLLFGILILVNVLTPYSNDLEERNTIELAIKKYESEIQEIEKSLQPLNELAKVLDNIQTLVANRPWDVETQKLIDKFREMNNKGGTSWSEYQAKADATINSVADLVNRTVISPLNDFLADSPTSENLIPELALELGTVRNTVTTWVAENKGKRWYRTIEMKEAQIDRLSDTLGNKLNSVSMMIDRERPNLITRQEHLKTSIEKLRNNSDFRNKKERLNDLQSQMEKILPEWLRGMISVEQMVQIFPFIIVTLAASALSIALAVASHYRFLARELNFGEAGRSDPSFSSLWTLTYRGRSGTLLTVSVYTIFVLAMWFFFEFGVGILAKWLKTRDTWFINTDTFPIISWLCRILLVVLITYIAIHPYRQKRKGEVVQATSEKK